MSGAGARPWLTWAAECEWEKPEAYVNWQPGSTGFVVFFKDYEC